MLPYYEPTHLVAGAVAVTAVAIFLTIRYLSRRAGYAALNLMLGVLFFAGLALLPQVITQSVLMFLYLSAALTFTAIVGRWSYYKWRFEVVLDETRALDRYLNR